MDKGEITKPQWKKREPANSEFNSKAYNNACPQFWKNLNLNSSLIVTKEQMLLHLATHGMFLE